MRPIVSIASPGNGSGKTSLGVTILRAHPGVLTAVKMTTVYRNGANCPRTETACACRSLHGPYTVISDEAVVAAPGTDTGKLHAAGARRTLWCLSIPSATSIAWRHLTTEILETEEPLLTEGNRIAGTADPGLLFFVVSPATPRARWKSDTWDLIARASAVIVNPHAGAQGAVEPGASEALVAEIGGRCGARVIVQDVTLPLERWPDPEPARLLRERLGAAGPAHPAAGG